jgi:hypothetical protein
MSNGRPGPMLECANWFKSPGDGKGRFRTSWGVGGTKLNDKEAVDGTQDVNA